MNITLIALLVLVVTSLTLRFTRERWVDTPIGRKADTVAAWVFGLVGSVITVTLVVGFLWYAGLRSTLEVIGLVFFAGLTFAIPVTILGILLDMPGQHGSRRLGE